MTGSNIPGSGWGHDDEGREKGNEDGWDEPGNASAGQSGDDNLDNGRLDLADDDDTSLPWLEAGDDDSAYESSDGMRILGLVLAGLVVLAAIIGGIWWATHRDTDTELVADGGTIEPPATPFKESPGNPGGKTFDGTGDTSFAMSEGQSSPARLGEATGAPPSPATSPTPSSGASPKPSPRPSIDLGSTPAPTGVGVQVGAYSSREAAEAGWTRLSTNPALSGIKHRVMEGQADIGTVYRLQAVAGDAAAANALCGKLKASGIACQVKN